MFSLGKSGEQPKLLRDGPVIDRPRYFLANLRERLFSEDVGGSLELVVERERCEDTASLHCR